MSSSRHVDPVYRPKKSGVERKSMKRPKTNSSSPSQTHHHPRPSSPSVDRAGSTSAPRVLLLDVDGTLIGDITPQLCEYELVQRFDKRRTNAFKDDVVTYLRDGGVLRPNLQNLLSTLRRASPDVELFVYTASSDDWAKVIVPCIEKAAGVRFNRPLFTRKHCVLPSDAKHDMDFKKSIAKVAPAIHRALAVKNPGNGDHFGIDDVRRGCILVDNNPHVLLDPEGETVQLVKVPTYNGAMYYDVMARVPLEVGRRNAQEVRQILTRFGMYSANRYSADDMLSFHMHFFADLARLADYEHDRRKAEAPDGLWVAIADVLATTAQRFTPTTVRIMNEAVRGGKNRRK